MKIAVCDDDSGILKLLQGFIRQYADENLLDYTILEFTSSESLLKAVKKDPDIKILFLDIYLPSLSGMELAETLRSEGIGCAIIFVTVSTEHYARSYEVNAVHYLVKPITYERVDTALSRCRELLAASAKCASFSSGGEEILIPLRDIRFIEVFRNQTLIHADRTISLRCTLEHAAGRLTDPRFFQTHRSYYLNLEYVAEKQGHDIYLKTGERVPLSRACEKNFEREYGRFLTGAITGSAI